MRRPDPRRWDRCRLVRWATVAMFALLALLAAAGPASGHAALAATSPADGEVVATAPARVSFEFNEPVSAASGALRVFDAEGRRVDDAVQVQSDPTTVSVGLGALDDGGYVATYRVASADGHVIRGALTFEVGSGTAVDDDTVAALFAAGSDSVVAVAATIVAVLGMAGALVAVGAMAFPRPTPLVRRLADDTTAVAATVGGIAAVVTVPLHAMATSGLGLAALGSTTVLGEALSSPVGVAAATRVAGLLGLYAAARTTRPVRRFGTGAAAVLVLASFLLEGHTRTVDPAWLVLSADAVHVAAIATWTGGLVVVARLLRTTSLPPVAGGAVDVAPPGDAPAAVAPGDSPARVAAVVAGFSGRALWALSAAGVAGAAMTWALARQPRALVTTDWGWALVVKLGLVAVVVLVAAYNRLRLVPAVTGGGRGARTGRRLLVTTMRIEAIVLALVLATTGVLVGLRPGAEAAGITGAFDTVVAAGEGRSVNLVVDPNVAGANEIHVYALDASGRPTDEVDDVTLELVQVTRDVGPIVREAATAGPGHWVLSSRDLGIPGEWLVTVVLGLGRFDEERVEVPVVVNPG